MTPQEGLAGALRDHLIAHHSGVPPRFRPGSRWVMNEEWLAEVRKLADRRGLAPLELRGLPVEVRDDGGVPHLESPALQARLAGKATS